jgi:lipopolysaccharide/colanic/teichoic acid biosynthesis glycosyltransferase
MIKRVFDIVMSLAALLALSPVLIAVGIIIAVTSPGGAFYHQIRVGRGCAPFRMVKFRSMVANADQIGGYSTAAGDPRITPIGRFVRRTSIDELPQLLNVLKGDMSLVGPRPDVPAQEELHDPADWQERHKVRPGITGMAQALSRGTATVEERLAMDLKYVREQSLWLDLKIIWWTVRQVLGRGGF